MKSQEHFEMVLNLKKSGASILKNWTHTEASMAHMLTGVCDEWLELTQALLTSDRDNAVEEMGDLIFYVQGLRYDAGLYPINLEGIGQDAGDKPTPYVPYVVSGIISVVKGHLYYGKPLDRDKLDLLTTKLIQTVLLVMRAHFGKEEQIGYILEENYKKLMKRYPTGGYRDKDAKERKDKI